MIRRIKIKCRDKQHTDCEFEIALPNEIARLSVGQQQVSAERMLTFVDISREVSFRSLKAKRFAPSAVATAT